MATTTIAAGTMKAAQVSRPGASLEIVEREIREPGPGQVRIKVQACGVCRAFQGMKWQTSSTKWAPAFPNGRMGSAPAWVGMVDRTAPVASAAWGFSQLPKPENSRDQL